MSNLSKQQFPPMYHGTRAKIKGGVILPSAVTGEGVHTRAWATSDPEQAVFFGESKIPRTGEVTFPTVYKVEPLTSEYHEEHGNVAGEMFYTSPHGFRIIGEHK